MTSDPSPPNDLPQTALALTSSPEVSRARISALQAKVRALLASEAGSGGNTPVSSRRSGRAGPSSKMSPPFALAAWMSCSGHSLRSGMMRSGTVFPLPPLVPPTSASASGYWPTPNTIDAKGCTRNGPGQVQLCHVVRMWPTPKARDYRSGSQATQADRGRSAGPDLSEVVGGLLNPMWVEWLMQFPAEWTGYARLATPSCRKSPDSSARLF